MYLYIFRTVTKISEVKISLSRLLLFLLVECAQTGKPERRPQVSLNWCLQPTEEITTTNKKVHLLWNFFFLCFSFLSLFTFSISLRKINGYNNTSRVNFSCFIFCYFNFNETLSTSFRSTERQLYKLKI